jgi:hypothetical protein
MSASSSRPIGSLIAITRRESGAWKSAKWRHSVAEDEQYDRRRTGRAAALRVGE